MDELFVGLGFEPTSNEVDELLLVRVAEKFISEIADSLGVEQLFETTPRI